MSCVFEVSTTGFWRGFNVSEKGWYRALKTAKSVATSHKSRVAVRLACRRGGPLTQVVCKPVWKKGTNLVDRIDCSAVSDEGGSEYLLAGKTRRKRRRKKR